MARLRARLAGPRLAWSILAAPACQGHTTPAADPRPLPVTVPEVPPPPAPSAAEAPARRVTKGPESGSIRPREDPPARALAYTSAGRGVLVVWSRHDPTAGESELLAVALDDRGHVHGAPRLVRRIRGQILDVAVHRREGAAWLAWTALLTDTPRSQVVVAALALEPDLSAAHPTISVDHFHGLAWPDTPMIRVRDLASGHAVVAAVTGAVECIDSVADGASTCSGFALTWVHQDGSIVRAGHTGASGRDPGLGSLIDLGTGVLVDTWAWRGAPTFSTIYAPYDQIVGDAPVDIVHCYPPFSRMWTGAELVTVCPEERAEPGQRCWINGYYLDMKPHICERVHVAGLDHRSATRGELAPLTTYLERCVRRNAGIEVRWSGGKRVIDPRTPGASFDSGIGVWTGRHAIEVDPSGERTRWNCKSNDFELSTFRDGPDLADDPIPLDPPDPVPVPEVP